MPHIRLLLISALLAAGTVLSLTILFRTSVPAATHAEEKKQVIVATKNIPERILITAEMLTTKEVITSDVPTGTVSQLNTIVGQVSLQPIVQGEMVLAGMVTRPDGSLFSMKLAKGQRAISLAYNEVMGVGGYLLPGDRVDVVLTFNKDAVHGKSDLSRITLQDIEVLAVGQQSRRSEGASTSASPATAASSSSSATAKATSTRTGTITLSVKPEQAEQLAFAEQFGTMKLLLRSPADQNRLPTPGVTNETAGSIK